MKVLLVVGLFVLVACAPEPAPAPAPAPPEDQVYCLALGCPGSPPDPGPMRVTDG